MWLEYNQYNLADVKNRSVRLHAGPDLLELGLLDVVFNYCD